MFEVDCCMTRDRQVVISHDDFLLRTTGHEVYISQTDYQDLPELKSQLEITFCPRETVTGKDRKIPLLRDLFHTFPNTPINVDMKDQPETAIDETLQLIQDYKRENITVWGSTQWRVSGLCRKKSQDIPCFVNLKAAVCFFLSFYCGLLPFLPIPAECMEVPMPSIWLKKDRFKLTFTPSQLLAIRILDWLMMSPVFFRHLRRRGMHVYLWVLNDEEEFTRAFTLGIDGVMTDYPAKLMQFFEKYPHLR